MCCVNFPPFLKYFLYVFSRVAPPPKFFPLQTAFHFGGPSDPLSRVESFQGSLMDANGGLFQIILQGQALICRLACSPQTGYPENMQIPLPSTHTQKHL